LKLKLEKFMISVKLAQHGIGTALAVALASRVIVVIVSLAAVSLVGVRNVAGWRIEVPLAGIFARWDSAYYLTIARDGYVQENLYAFRPLYPLLLRTLAATVNRIDWQTMTIIGFTVNNLFFFVSAFFLYRLTELILDRERAYRVVALFSFLPGTVYLSAIYPEALYLALLFASFYYLRKLKVVTAAFLSFLATLTRPEGIAASIIFLIMALQQIDVGRWWLRIRRSFFCYLSAMMLPIAGAVVLGLYAGDIMQPFRSELMWDKWALNRFIGAWWLTEPDGPPAVLSYIVLLPLLGTLALGAGKMVKDENLRGYLIWSLTLLILFLTSADFRSLPRLSLQIAPAYWILSSSSHWQAFLALLTPLAVCGTILYASWYPIL